MSVDFWRTVSLFGVALGQTLFVLLYWTFPWYKTFLGRALFYKSLMLATIVDAFIVARILDVELDALFVVLYTMLGIGVWWQLIAFFRVRWAGKQNRDNPHRDVVSGNANYDADAYIRRQQ